MDENQPHNSPKQVPIRDIKSDPTADDLLDSVAMEPYMNLAIAMMGGRDTTPSVEALMALPIEQRYVWRVASALKWAFVDFDSLNVKADRETMSEEDRTQLVELLKHRPLQFCLFLSALFGQKNMEVMILSAIKNARAMAAHSNAAEE